LALLLLAMIGFFRKRSVPLLNFARFALVFVFLSTFGIVTPYLLFHIPVVNSVRELYLYLYVLPVPFAILVAEGISAILVSVREKQFLPNLLLGRAWIVFPLMGLASAAYLSLSRAYANTLSFWIGLLEVAAVIFLLTCVFTFKKKTIQKRMFSAASCVVVFVICEYLLVFFGMGFVGGFNAVSLNQSVKAYDASLAPLFSMIGEDKREGLLFYPYRVSQWEVDLMPAALEAYSHRGLYTLSNPTASNAVYVHTNMPIDKRAILQNVRYLITPTTEMTDAYYPMLGFQRIGTAETAASMSTNELIDVTVWKTEAIGEAWLVGSVAPYPPQSTEEDAIAAVASLDFNPQTQAAMDAEVCETMLSAFAGALEEDWPYFEYPVADASNAPSGEVALSKLRADECAFEVQTNNPAILVTAQYNYPGWKVYVNGEETEAIEVNGAFIGILLEPGEYEVELRYRPDSLLYGAVISSVFVLFCILSLLIGRRKRPV
jgi:hypothetical protein